VRAWATTRVSTQWILTICSVSELRKLRTQGSRSITTTSRLLSWKRNWSLWGRWVSLEMLMVKVVRLTGSQSTSSSLSWRSSYKRRSSSSTSRTSCKAQQSKRQRTPTNTRSSSSNSKKISASGSRSMLSFRFRWRRKKRPGKDIRRRSNVSKMRIRELNRSYRSWTRKNPLS